MPLMALRLAAPETIVDLGGLQGMTYVRVADDGVTRIGANTTQTQILRSHEISRAAPLVIEAVRLIAHEGIRNRSTVGGSLAHADPAAEWPALAITLEAEILVYGPRGERTIPAAHFFEGPFMTALQPGELVTEIGIPCTSTRHGHSVVEVTQRAGDFALAGAMASLALYERQIERANIAFFGLAGKPFRPEGLEAALIGKSRVEALDIVGSLLPGADAYTDDVHASSEFKAHLARVVARRAIGTAMDQSIKGNYDG